MLERGAFNRFQVTSGGGLPEVLQAEVPRGLLGRPDPDGQRLRGAGHRGPRAAHEARGATILCS